FALDGRPIVEPVDFAHGILHPLLKGNQGFAQGRLADVADDAGGNFVVGLVAPGGAQGGLAEAVLVEQQAYLFELFAGGSCANASPS
ncbi:hypothetical protein MNBD_GAMMA20-1226, partial [hydrothermal vent metagenome]